VTDVPLYQPGDTKLLRITLTRQEWDRLVTRCIASDDSLEEVVNGIVRAAAAAGATRFSPAVTVAVAMGVGFVCGIVATTAFFLILIIR
jgi:hypothetical protein